jgi:hypothetical protein
VSPITSDNVETIDGAPHAGAPETAPASRLSGTPEWLLRVSIESVLIVISILLALAVDQWRDTRNNRLLAQQSLEIFEREIRRNLAALDEMIPYHNGVREVATKMVEQPERVVEVRSLMEGLRPVVLHSTAWEAALATGALRYMDFETVYALSVTYSSQDRFREELRAGAPRLVPGVDAGLPEMQQAVGYLTEMTRSEQDLHAVYFQALKALELAIGPGRTRASAAARDSAHPERH